ncbi:hypothetical protein ACF3NR_03880 [Vaginella massiliensis]
MLWKLYYWYYNNGNYKIKAGVYNLDTTIGEYGGYKLPYFEL